MLSGYMASTPQLTSTANRPRCRVSRPASGTAAALASAVITLATAMALSVLKDFVTSASGYMISVIPGGCTMMKSR